MMTPSEMLLIFIGMIFCHIVDDFYLQGILKNLKQKSWWREQTTDNLYEYDYLVALCIHGISWSISILFPFIAWCLAKGVDARLYLLAILAANTVLHCIMDNAKANKHRTNLLTDQIFHFGQIFITWFVLAVVNG